MNAADKPAGAPRGGSRGFDPSLTFLALLSYVPLLLTQPGKIAADTKAYLYLEPGRLLSRAAWLWQENTSAGTITHQNIGYLFPLGPYYWLADRLGLPDWVAQRFWLGSVLFAAGAGARWLAKRLDLQGAAAGVAGLVYLTSPYVVPYLGRTSVLLLPWAALPWLIALVIVALRTQRWLAPVIFSLVLTAVGGTNASSLVFVALGPLLWLPFAVYSLREVSVRDAGRTVLRLAVTTIPTQLWWMAGLRIQGRYGLPILKLTESVDTVAQTSTAAEVSRGLGYWYDYGRDGLSPWTEAAGGYTQHLWLIAVSFAIPLLALAAACMIRWRMRTYAVALFAVGLIAGIGTYPYADPPVLGALLKATTETAAGLALRNTPRAVPLVGLAYALFIGAGLTALADWLRPRRQTLVRMSTVTVCVIALCVANAQPLFTGAYVSHDLRFPEELPQYWQDAMAALDAKPHDTRVMELPGSDFAAYRWGQTQDPITPGLLDRAWLGRELTAFGTPGSVDLMRALDRRAQEGIFDANAVAPIASLFSAGDVLVRNDTQYERYRGPRPKTFWGSFANIRNLGAPTTYGTPIPNVADPRRPMIDEPELGTPSTLATPPPLATFAVANPRSMIDVRSTASATVVAGDGDGLVDLAESGLLDPQHLVAYSATFAQQPTVLRSMAQQSAQLVLTDENRKRAQRWGTVRENNGYTEPAASQSLVTDTKDTRIALFPNAGVDAYTVARYVGVADIAASTYGNIVAYSPERRAANVLDGDVRTSWEVGGFSEVVGERVRITLNEPITVDHIDVAQSNGNRYITTLGVKLDDGPVQPFTTDDSSHTDEGQRLAFTTPQTFRVIELSILDANVKGLQNYLGWSTAGLREVRIPGVHMEEQIVLPRDLLGTLGAASDNNPLTVMLSRQRADAAEPFRADPETHLVRAFTLPSARTFALSGQARLESRADGALIDTSLGIVGLAADAPSASGGDFLAGAVQVRPSAAIDGDPSTYWSPNLGDQNGRGFHVALAAPTTLDHLDVTLVADGRHSVPLRMQLELDGGGTAELDLATADVAPNAGTVTRHVSFAPVSTTGFWVRVTAVRDVTSIEYFSGEESPLPVAIAELGLPARRAPMPTTIDVCRDDLLTVDGVAVPVKLAASTPDVAARAPIAITTCDGAPLTLAAGEHVVRSSNGIDAGFAIDRVVLASAASAGAPTASATADATTAAAAVPTIATTTHSTDKYDATITDATAPFWFVLHESVSDGWRATINDRDLGPATMVDGYANGWLIDPAVYGPTFTVHLAWAPQRVIWIALAISGTAFIALLVALAWLARRERRVVGRWTADEPVPAPRICGRDATFTRPARGAILAAFGWAVLGLLVGGVNVALAVGVLVLVSVLVPQARNVLRVVPALSFAFVAAWYVLKQYRNQYPMGVEWPHSFATTHAVVLVALCCLLADTVLGRARRN